MIIFKTIIILSCLLFVGYRIGSSIEFNQNCGGYLKRAANANTIEMASKEVHKALEYMNRNNLKEGYTSIFWKTPDEDVGYWYSNILTSLNELESIPESATPLERSNVLMKLRETLLDRGENGDKLSAPDGISVYPDNKGLFLWGLISFMSLVFLFPFVFGIFSELDD